MTQQQTINAQMTISTILEMFPDKAQRLAQEITNAGLHCVGCNAATWETLEGGMLGHGKRADEVQRLVDRLNSLLAEKVDHTTISMTPEAAKKFVEFTTLDGKAGWALRFGEELAGCSGFEYILDYSEKATEEDEVYTSHGVQIHVNRKMLPRLIGSQIDFIHGIRDSGFKVINPNVRSACGCGTSHGYK